MSSLLHRLIIIGQTLCMVCACQDNSISASSKIEYESIQVESSSFAVDLPEPSRMSESSLPAYISQEEHSISKQDQFDLRGDFRSIYGRTSAPLGPTRSIAEFEATEAVLISWDNNHAQYLFNLIRLSASRAKVWVLTRSVSESKQLETALIRDGVAPERLGFFEYRHESVWTRDYGPWTIVDEQGQPALVDFKYYRERRRDDAIPTLVSRHFSVPVYRPDLEIEGGNFMSDGSGRCFFSSSVLKVNFAKNNQDLADLFYEYLGCTQALVLEPLIGEGTGHIDMFAKLTGPNTLLLGEYDRSVDPMNRALLERNAQRIEDFAQQNDWPLEIVRIPMPAPRRSGAYPSYTNSLIVNDLVIVPVYPSQRRFQTQAQDAYQKAFSNLYEITFIDADLIIEMGGAVHCTTMGFVQALNLVDPADQGTTPRLPGDSLVPSLGNTSNSLVFRSNTAKTIPDLGEIYDKITVSIDNIDNLSDRFQVKLKISHGYPSDLRISLLHQNQEIVLFNRDNSNTIGLEKDFVIARPQNYNPNGDWTLLIQDLEAQDNGVLESWSLGF